MSKMPGFTADTSLHKIGKYYYMVGTHNALTGYGSDSETNPNTVQIAQFCRPGCGQCREVTPGQWQQECINPSCETRTQRCVPTPLCGSCVSDRNSSTGYSEDCFYPGALNPAHFKRPCTPSQPPPGDGGDGCSWYQYIWCPPHWAFCKVFCAQSTDKDKCYHGCTAPLGCDC